MTYVYIHAAQFGLVRILSLYLTYLRSCYPPLYRVTKILSWRALFHSLFRHWHNRIQTFTSHVNVRDGRLFGCYLFYKDREWQKSVENNWLTLTRSRKASAAPAQERRSSLRHAKGAGLRGFSSFQPLGEKAATNSCACVRACVRLFILT